MKIFYINLDHRADRRQFMEDQLGQHGLMAERISAITPDKLEETLLDEYARKESGGGITPCELACSMSHRLAWKRMIELGLEHALFLEDDVVLSGHLPRFIDELSVKTLDFDIVRLETRKQLIQVGPIASPFACGIKLRKAYTAQWGLAGYVLSTNCAKLMLSAPGFFEMPVDHIFFDPESHLFGQIHSFQCCPGLVIPSELFDQSMPGGVSQSDLDIERRKRLKRCSQKVHGIKKIMREMKRIEKQIRRTAGRLGYFLGIPVFWTRVPFKK